MIRIDEFKNFVKSKYLEYNDFIPLHDPRFIGNERLYIADCINSNFVSSVGEYVTKFENMCSEYTGAKHAIAAVNGTSALHISLLLAGVKEGDEVITQALTFIATANAISYLKAIPVFLDVDQNTKGLSHRAVKEWLSEFAVYSNSKSCFINKLTGRRIAACVPMHTFGHPVKLDELIDVLTEYNIPLVEDAAEGMGSFYKGKHVGTFGKLGIVSFNGNKIITTGGGGMILTDDPDLARQAKHITTQAKIPHSWEFKHDMIAYNYRLTNLAAALGCAQIEKLDEIISIKRALARDYHEFFENEQIRFVTEPENAKSNYWLNAIILRNKEERDDFLKQSNENGVMTRPIWELMTNLDMFKSNQSDNLYNSKFLADRVVNIPSSANIPNYRKNI